MPTWLRKPEEQQDCSLHELLVEIDPRFLWVLAELAQELLYRHLVEEAVQEAWWREDLPQGSARCSPLRPIRWSTRAAQELGPLVVPTRTRLPKHCG